MAVSNDDLFAWVQQAKTDRPGVRLAMDGLDLEEARDVAARVFSYLAAMVIIQDTHIDQLNEIIPALRGMSTDEQLRALQVWIQELPAGSITLGQIMHGQDPHLDEDGPT
jgi:hypothetical protein